MEQLPTIMFFDSERMGQFFQFLWVVLFFVMPLLMVWAAIEYAGIFISVIKRVFVPSDQQKERDQERYDIKYKDYK